MLFAIIIAIVVIVAIVLAFVGIYNSLVKKRNTVEEAFSTMDVYMKKRFDLIPNLVETVKGYAAHEKDTLERVISARNMAQSASTSEGRLQGEAALSGALKSLFAVAEGYPQLRANENFLGLQSQLADVEDDIASARKYYNGTVRIYNTKTELFPSALVASMFRFGRKPLYEIADTAERGNVKVQF
ncbi:MAG: LemA family protein [Clostridiales Family XIII bacterium]|nr:LemA family protein [Clostridiales Family XIII bacterium]